MGAGICAFEVGVEDHGNQLRWAPFLLRRDWGLQRRLYLRLDLGKVYIKIQTVLYEELAILTAGVNGQMGKGLQGII